MQQNASEIAASFVSAWAEAWNGEGAGAAAKLYTQDSVLVGAAIGVGRAEIERLLGLLYQQGWTKIAITVVDARSVDAVVLVVSEFVAEGVGPNAGKSLKGKSSHVLTRVGDAWLSAMHTTA
jgi:ketosteroid isomerase-like protein